MRMYILIPFIGACVIALLFYYVYILMRGDE